MSIDLFLQHNDNLLPPDQVRIDAISATPYPDRRRIQVEVSITPFKERPNLEIWIEDTSGKVVAETSVIAVMNFTAAYNLHLRGIVEPAGDYAVRVLLYYDNIRSPQHTCQITLHIPAASPAGDQVDQD
ncbi:MAG: hypothetical protein JXJ20_10505 [Anaerolineae bacterium]|nr:hypothetical protein [Anaerolineae bacterium]